MDGVIIDSQSIADKLLTQTAKKFGVQVTEQELHSLHGIPIESFWQYVKETYNLPESAEYYGSHYDVEEEIRMYHDLLPIDGIPQLVEDLKSHNVSLALATSASRYRMQIVLDLFEMHDTFDAVVTKDDVTRAKPDPEIFIKAAGLLHIPPSESIVIEDAVNGLVAAHQAHMKCVLYWKKKSKIKSPVQADLITDDFTKINFAKLSALQ